jgi:hypothetical protein
LEASKIFGDDFSFCGKFLVLAKNLNGPKELLDSISAKLKIEFSHVVDFWLFWISNNVEDEDEAVISAQRHLSIDLFWELKAKLCRDAESVKQICVLANK